MATSNTNLGLDRLTVRVTLRILRSPNTYTARSLARELGETPTRISRIVQAIEREGELQRLPQGTLSVRPGLPTGGDN